MQNVTRRRKKPPVLTGDGLDGLTVPQLKDKLRPLQLKLAGRKSELVARLRAHYASSDGSEALNALVDADDTQEAAPGFRVLAPPPADADAAEAPSEAVAPEEPAAPEAAAAAPPVDVVAPEEPVVPAEPLTTAPVASEESVPEPTVEAASEEPSTADEAAEDTAKATRRAALAARRAAVAARRAAAAPSVDPVAAAPAPVEAPVEASATESFSRSAATCSC